MNGGLLARCVSLLALTMIIPACSPPAASSTANISPTPSAAKSIEFTLDEVQKLRKDLRGAVAVSNSYPDGWSRGKEDPAGMLSALPTLKKGMLLRAYIFRAGPNGNGIVWAMPEGAPFPEPKDIPQGKESIMGLSRPPEALDLMVGIEGDGSPLSYLSASLLFRQARDYAAEWHGVGWGHHRILGADPRGAGRAPAKGLGDGPTGAAGDWQWNGQKPQDWRPRVVVVGDTVTVTFITFSALGNQTLFRHTDTYRAGQYTAETLLEEIASGPPGYMV